MPMIEFLLFQSQDMGQLFGALSGVGFIVWIAALVFGILLSILWLFVPFAIFGIKPRLDQMNESLRILCEWEKFKFEQLGKAESGQGESATTGAPNDEPAP
ncbi:MAG TPA: hypothetical protein VKA53_05645 [Thermoanaerobaculia bacterium]|nr:hypothetical protein [Thermoanaerobaculia bacterium]